MTTDVPEITSAEALKLYPPGQQIAAGEGAAWKDIQLSVFSLSSEAERFNMPAVVEPFIVWVISGDAETRERGSSQEEWQAHHIKANSLYLTFADAPYEFEWRRLSTEPFQVMLLVLNLPLFEQALNELYGNKAKFASMPNVSGFNDDKLIPLLMQLKDEANKREASEMFVKGIAQAIAVHLARNYVEFSDISREDSSSLPGYKLKRIVEWMKANLSEEFSLLALAQQADMSEFHFNRLFKRAVGIPPSQYYIRLRLELARRLLRETNLSVIDIANQVGYSNPSHFAQLFRKNTGISPSDYRRQD